jgi:hypothetical protein
MKNSAAITLARCLAVVWAGFWIWFGVASSFSGNAGGMTGMLHLLPWATWAVASIVVAWRNPVAGGGLLLLEGLVLGFLVATYMPAHYRRFDFLTLALPPVVAGLLFLSAGHHRRAPHPA